MPFIGSAGIRMPQKKEERRAAALRSSFFCLLLSEKFTKSGLVKGAEVWYNTGISHPGKVAGERKCAVFCTKATEYCAK